MVVVVAAVVVVVVGAVAVVAAVVEPLARHRLDASSGLLLRPYVISDAPLLCLALRPMPFGQPT